MEKTRFTELQKEIERLQAIDKATTERVEAELNQEIEIPCSLALDMQMANESENIM